MLTQDSEFFFQKLENYDVLMMISTMMVDYYNFLLSIPFLSEQEYKSIQDELNSYKCYDV